MKFYIYVSRIVLKNSHTLREIIQVKFVTKKGKIAADKQFSDPVDPYLIN